MQLRLILDENNLLKKIKLTQQEVGNAFKELLRSDLQRMIRLLKRKHLSGGTSPTRLAVRSRELIDSVHVGRILRRNKKIFGRIKIDAPYASVHIAPDGTKTKITPKNAKALAIPILYGKTTNGLSKAKKGSSIRDQFPFLSYVKRDKQRKNPLLVDLRAGNFRPWFVLVKEVTIKSRVDPDKFLKSQLPAFNKKARALIKLFNKKVT